MSVEVGQGVVPIHADFSGFGKDVDNGMKKAFDGADRTLGDQGARMGDKVSGGFTTKLKGGLLPVAGIIGGAFAADAVLGFGAKLLDLGTQTDVFRRKVQTVFGPEANDIKRWADANNEAMGVTDDQLAGLAAGFGDLLVPMGFTREAAADMSMKTIELSGALSAWSGGQRSAAEVAEILQDAMLGERESLKGLGISISEADVSQRLMEKGQQDLTGAARQQAEALATQELIMEKSTDAQKAWTNGSMDNTKVQNELKAKFAEVTETLGTKLLPIAVSFGNWLVNTGIPFAERMADKIAGFARAVWNAGRDVAEFVTAAKQKFDSMLDFVKGFPGSVGRALSSLAEVLIFPYKLAFNAIAKMWNNTVGKLSFKVPGWVPGIGGKGWDVPNVPVLHSGGEFRAPMPGGEGFAWLRDREVVTTPEQQSAIFKELRELREDRAPGGPLVHIDTFVASDPVDVDLLGRRLAFASQGVFG